MLLGSIFIFNLCNKVYNTFPKIDCYVCNIAQWTYFVSNYQIMIWVQEKSLLKQDVFKTCCALVKIWNPVSLVKWIPYGFKVSPLNILYQYVKNKESKIGTIKWGIKAVPYTSAYIIQNHCNTLICGHCFVDIGESRKMHRIWGNCNCCWFLSPYS